MTSNILKKGRKRGRLLEEEKQKDEENNVEKKQTALSQRALLPREAKLSNLIKKSYLPPSKKTKIQENIKIIKPVKQSSPSTLRLGRKKSSPKKTKIQENIKNIKPIKKSSLNILKTVKNRPSSKVTNIQKNRKNVKPIKKSSRSFLKIVKSRPSSKLTEIQENVKNVKPRKKSQSILKIGRKRRSLLKVENKKIESRKGKRMHKSKSVKIEKKLLTLGTKNSSGDISKKYTDKHVKKCTYTDKLVKKYTYTDKHVKACYDKLTRFYKRKYNIIRKNFSVSLTNCRFLVRAMDSTGQYYCPDEFNYFVPYLPDELIEDVYRYKFNLKNLKINLIDCGYLLNSDLTYRVTPEQPSPDIENIERNNLEVEEIILNKNKEIKISSNSENERNLLSQPSSATELLPSLVSRDLLPSSKVASESQIEQCLLKDNVQNAMVTAENSKAVSRKSGFEVNKKNGNVQNNETLKNIGVIESENTHNNDMENVLIINKKVKKNEVLKGKINIQNCEVMQENMEVENIERKRNIQVSEIMKEKDKCIRLSENCGNNSTINKKVGTLPRVSILSLWSMWNRRVPRPHLILDDFRSYYERIKHKSKVTNDNSEVNSELLLNNNSDGYKLFDETSSLINNLFKDFYERQININTTSLNICDTSTEEFEESERMDEEIINYYDLRTPIEIKRIDFENIFDVEEIPSEYMDMRKKYAYKEYLELMDDPSINYEPSYNRQFRAFLRNYYEDHIVAKYEFEKAGQFINEMNEERGNSLELLLSKIDEQVNLIESEI